MRHSLVVGLILIACCAALGADAPIPQDTARMEKRARDWLEWNRRTLGGSYDKVGKKDAKWDKPAREACDLAARMMSLYDDPVVLPPAIHAEAKKAVDAGCDDPLILYLHARTSVGKEYPGPEEYARRVRAAADAMLPSAYPPYRRANALLAAAEINAWKENPAPTPGERADTEQELDAVLGLLPASVAEDPRNEFWEERWYDLINSVINAHRKLSGDYKAAFDRVDAKLAKVNGIEPLRLTVKGNFLIHWGWEARTNAFAPKVTEEQFRTFHQRLTDARAALEEAWKLKPGQPKVPDLMLVVEKGIGEGDRQAMETWFERAMTYNGNDQDACWSKLDWLDPKWYGGDTMEPMLAFGKACRATKNWHNGITLLAADAHLRCFMRLGREERMEYMGSAWQEIKEVYDEYLKHYPYDDVQRSKYAALAYLCGRPAEAHALFEALGDRLTAWTSAPRFPLEQLKRFRDDAARRVANKPGVNDK